MPADIQATHYNWYMVDDPAKRTVAYAWWPEGKFESSMTFGKLYFMHREEPDDVWAPAVFFGEMPWVVAQTLARREGFPVEVPYYEDGTPPSGEEN